MVSPSPSKPAKESPSGGRSRPVSASSRTTLTGVTLGGAAAAARELSADQLIDVRLTLPKKMSGPNEMSGALIAEFQLTLTEAFRLFLDNKLVVAQAETNGRSPTPRLRRAIANTDKLKNARFANAEDLFDDLAKAEG